jgi:hypothetical protein
MTSMVITYEMGPRSDRTSVALPKEIVDKARALSALASKNGWAALGIDRDDPPTITAIFEQAIESLAARAKKEGKR